MQKERDDNDISMNSMIYISLLIHTVVLSIIFFAPSLPSPKWTFGPVYSVNLVSLSEVLQERKAQSVISREINQTIPGEHSSILKKRPDTIPAVPIKRLDSPRKQTSSVDRAIEDIRKKVNTGVSPPGSSSRTDNAESDAKMNVYYSLIWSRIKGKWTLPQGILPRESIEAIIQAKILKNGTVVDLSFEKRSGNRYFDESAMKAMKKASPLPPLPDSVRENSIDVGIRFHSLEFR
ncbi:MAG: TonB family protein [Syntrophales bacterium LBB04]|nr:TonB family protein [Syntrophales bacterium LBB04]